MKKILILFICCLFGVACTTLEDSLRQAVEQNDEIAVNNVLNRGINPNFNSSDNTPLLILAAAQGNESIVKSLIKAGADINATDKNNWTALMTAVKERNTEIVQILVNAGADVNKKGDTLNKSPYTRCVGFYCHNSYSSSHGITPLMIACQREQVDIVRILLKAGASVNVRGERGDTALIEATRRGNVEIVEMLIDAGADINLRNDERDSALSIADRKKYINTEKAILSSGATLPDGSTSLMIASINGYIDVAKKIIARGVDVNVQDKNDKQTALMLASLHDHPEIVELLLSVGANVHMKDKNGNTALGFARRFNNKKIINMLKAAGARY